MFIMYYLYFNSFLFIINSFFFSSYELIYVYWSRKLYMKMQMKFGKNQENENKKRDRNTNHKNKY